MFIFNFEYLYYNTLIMKDIILLLFSQSGKLEPIMLSVLPIIPSRISHNFYPYALFLVYSHVSDNDVHSLFSKWAYPV